jgi:hypothetical protein
MLFPSVLSRNAVFDFSMHEEMRICCFELRTSDFQIGGVAR